MKKTRKLLIALLLLVPAMSVSAFRFDFDNRILIGSGNEKLTMGINKNDDDFLIFNYTFAIVNGPFGFSSYLNAFTDRASNLRHDELIVATSWTIVPYENGSIRFRIRPTAGIDIDGDLGLSAVQALYNDLRRQEYADIPYVEETTVRPYADLMVEGAYTLAKHLRFGVDMTPQYWETFRFNIGAFVNWKRSGYRLGWDGTWSLRTTLDFGVLRFEHYKQLGGTIGFGTIMIDVLSPLRECTWQNSDAYMNLGIQVISDFEFITQQVMIRVNDWSSVTFTQRYTSGFPKVAEKDPYERVQRNHNNMALGYLVWLPSFWAFTPFVELDGGMARWQIDFLYNGASNSRKTLDPLKTAFAQLRIGASLIPEGFLKFDATTICLVASVDLNWYFSSDRITDYVKQDKYHKDDYVFKAFQPSVYIGLHVGLDLY
ncbi:MAG: hypothetical protein II813_04385 [Spirochaetales bacterium]|nr:hypothetical protein [Spirochaetales bacterium]